MDAKLARGSALTRPYAVCTVIVAKTARISEYGRGLDASVRRDGFAPLRLDLAHDVAVAASMDGFTAVPKGLPRSDVALALQPNRQPDYASSSQSGSERVLISAPVTGWANESAAACRK